MCLPLFPSPEFTSIIASTHLKDNWSIKKMSTLKCSSVNAGARVSSSPPTSMALDGQLDGIQNCREDKHLLVSVSEFPERLNKGERRSHSERG